MKRHLRYVFSVPVAVLVIMALLLSACGSETAAPASTATTAPAAATSAPAAEPTATTAAPTEAPKEAYKLGFVGALTGQGSYVGDPELKAAQLRIEIINKAGGVNGHPLELVSYDSEGSPEKALSFVRKLVEQDKVVAVIGPDFSSNVRAVADYVYKEANTPVYVMTPVYVPEAKSWMFATTAPTPLPTSKLFTYYKDQGFKKIGILAATDTTGQTELDAATKIAQGMGMEVIVERFALEDTDVTAQLTKIKGQNPDAMYVPVTGKVFGVVAKGIKQLGIDIPIGGSTGVASKDLPNLLQGIEPKTLLIPQYWIMAWDQIPATNPMKPVVEDFAKVYKEKYDLGVDIYSAEGWDIAGAYAEALKAVGPDKAKIRDFLETYQYVGASGIYKMTADDHHGSGMESLILIQLVDGKFKLVQ